MENWTPLQDLRKSKYNKGGKEDEDSERLKFWGTSDAIEKRVSQLPDVEGQEETLLKSRFQGPSPRSDMGQELSESTENSSNSGGPWKTLWERLTAGPRKPAKGDFTLKGRGFLQQGEREGFPEESVQKEQSGTIANLVRLQVLILLVRPGTYRKIQKSHPASLNQRRFLPCL